MSKFNKSRGGGSGRDRRPGGGGRGDRGGKPRGGRDGERGGPPKGQQGKQSGGGQRRDLQVERRDGSKVIKKGGQQGPRKISLQKLRTEGGGGQGGKGGKSMNMGGKGGKPGDKKGKKGRKDRRKGGGDRKDKLPKDPAARAEALDRDLESYWVKGGHTEIAQARLDDELDGYFAQKQEEVVVAPEAPATTEEDKRD